MSVYGRLTDHLKSLPGETWSTNFAEIERILCRSLPKSAFEHRPWWANQKEGNHSQSRAWRDAGWETRDVDLKGRTVRFERNRQALLAMSPGARPSSPTHSDLWQQAAEISGIKDRAELERAVLNCFIQREAGRQLAELGGSMPDIQPVPRRRFAW